MAIPVILEGVGRRADGPLGREPHCAPQVSDLTQRRHRGLSENLSVYIRLIVLCRLFRRERCVDRVLTDISASDLP